MCRVAPLLFLMLAVAAPARAHEYLTEGRAEAQLQFRFDRSVGASDGFFRLGFQIQPLDFLFFGLETANPPMRARGSVHCGTKFYERNRFWVASWLGVRHERLRAGLRLTRNVETIDPPICPPIDDGTEDYKYRFVDSTSVENDVTDHPGVMLEYRFSSALWAGVLYDHDFQTAAWATYRFPRLLLSLEGGRASIPHPPFPSYTRTDARLGVRFSPTLAPLARARFHLRVDVGVVHTDFVAQNRWTPEPPTALLVRVTLAAVIP
jgi:hypothetical protein